MLRHPGLALLVVSCVVLVVVVGAGSGAPGVSRPPAARERVTGVAMIPQDRRAPDFSLPLLSGSGTFSAHRLRGHVAVLNFWASWCAACRSEAGELRRTSADYRPRGVRFLGVDHRDDRGAARSFARAHGIDFPSVFDPAGEVLSKYGSAGLPSTFVVDRDGRIRYASIGTIDTTALRRGIDRLLAGHPPRADPSAHVVALSTLGGSPTTDFTLTDQYARQTALSDFAGQVVVLAFVDSTCEEVCALTAEALQKMLAELGSASSGVQLLAVNVNPAHAAVSDVRAWSREHSMLHRWRFLTGPRPALRQVWRNYAVDVARRNGDLVHDPGVYVIDQQQRERGFLWVSDENSSVDAEASALAGAVRSLRPDS